MIKDILKVLGGTVGMIFKFIFIIGFAFGAFYCVFTMFMFPFLWEGLKRLAIAGACVLGIVGLLLPADRSARLPTVWPSRPIVAARCQASTP